MTSNTGDLPAVRPIGAHRAQRPGWARRLARNLWAVLTGRTL